MNHQLHLTKPLAVFDLETTGMNPMKDRIVEIAVLKAMPNGEVIEFHSLVNPEIKIPKESSSIHHITNERVANEPTFKQIGKNLAKFLEGCDLAGYNVLKFDIPVLVEEFLRTGIDFGIEKRRFVDAQRIFFAMEKRTLTAAYKFYCKKDISQLGEGAHSAMSDTIATLEVLDAQVHRYENQEVTDNLEKKLGIVKNDVQSLHDLFNGRVVDLAGRMTYNHQGDIIFNFGKWKGTRVTEVFQKEPQYYDWMINNEFPLDTKNWLTKIKLGMAKMGN